MSEEKQIIIKEAIITNNCPVCYNQELGLTFYQKHTVNAFYHRTTKKVSHEIKCKKCHSVIHPVSWNQDIERVFEYYNKLVEPDKTSVRFTLVFYIMLIILLVLVGLGLYFYLKG